MCSHNYGIKDEIRYSRHTKGFNERRQNENNQKMSKNTYIKPAQ